MKNKGWRWLPPVMAASMALTGCGTVAAKTVAMAPASHAPKSSTMGSMATPSGGGLLKGVPSDVLVGAAASPQMGSGNGMLIVDSVGMKKTWKIPLTSGANAFSAAIDGNAVYVPTLQGTTYVVSLKTHQVVSQFASPTGDRTAVIAQSAHLLLLVGASNVTAYSLPSFKEAWQANIGGNALAVVGQQAYLSSNASSTTALLNLATGHVDATIPVGHIEDSVYDPQRHTLWLANWTNGDMTVVNTLDNQIVAEIQRKEGGGFSPTNMMTSSGGFMQLAVGPSGRHVYAASFSGNIMEYNASNNTFARDIPVNIPMAKLSGLAIDPSGQYAYTTVESHQETVSVSLKTGRVVSTVPHLMSNRWSVVSR